MLDVVSYGLHGDADLRAVDIVDDPKGIGFTAVGRGLRIAIRTHLPGRFNLANCLAALATATIGLGIDPAIAARGMGSLLGVPGRMERIDMGQAFVAIVDFAHTPNALEGRSGGRPECAGR